MLILDKGPTQWLDDTMVTVEVYYSINFSRSTKIFCLSLHYNGNNRFLFVNATKTYQIKAKNSEDNSGNFSIIWEKNRIKWVCDYLPVDYRPFDTSNIFVIHKYLMEKNIIK